MLDSVAKAVGLEAGFAFPYTPELTSMIGQDLSWLGIFMDSLVE